MSKQTFRSLSIVFWIAVASAFVAAHGTLTEQFSGEDGPGMVAVYVVVGVLALVGVLINTMMAERVFGSHSVGGDLSAMAPEERAAACEAHAKQALAAGNAREAIVAYENGGLYDKALSLAKSKGEFAMEGRLQLRAKRLEEALLAFTKANDHLMAGHLSLSLKRFQTARDCYAKYLEQKGGGLKPLERARYLDRAGKYAEAAAIYEQFGDFVRAADAFMLAGQTVQGIAAQERAAVLVAYERGQPDKARELASNKKRWMHESAVARELGDLFTVGWSLRDADSPLAAAEVFEGIEEWMRAASCYEAAGEMQKAMQLRAKANVAQAAPKPSAYPSTHQTAASQWSPPGAAAAALALSMDASAPPPTFLAPSSLPPAGPWSPVGGVGSVMQVVLPPGFVMPVKGMVAPQNKQGWRDFAHAVALNGDLNTAANIHLQEGDIPEAVTCLADAGRRHQAAMMALGAGDYGRAVELLVDQIDEGKSENIGLLLGRLLINLKEFILADELLRTRIAPKIGPENAEVVYQFARAMEEAEGYEYACRLYQQLIKSGASSAELEERLDRLYGKLAEIDNAPPAEPGDTNSALPSQIRRKMGAADFLTSMLSDSDDAIAKPKYLESQAPETRPAETKPTKPAKSYPFTPPPISKLVPKERITQEIRKPAALLPSPRNRVSLLGSAGRAPEKESASGEQFDPFQDDMRYRLTREIGTGGMGSVYEAHDLRLDRPVALKLLRSFGASPNVLRQFLLEARAIARIDHPNVIRVFDMGVMELQHYIAMELVHGKDLRAYLGEKGKLPLREALRIFVQTAEGLGCAHAGGVIHRDIKPGNILLNGDLDVRLIDFGIAKLHRPGTDAKAEADRLFKSAGTPGYMAPEQIRGEGIGPAADIYALGITLFQMITGQPPHRVLGITSNEEIISLQASGELPALSQARQDVPPAIEQLYRYCTAREITNRFQEVSAFLPTARKWMESL